MKIIVVTLCKNESRMMPWFLRHYGFADEIHVWHNACEEDSSTGMPPCWSGGFPSSDSKQYRPIRNYHYRTDGLRDDLHAWLKANHVKFQHGFDWCIAVDMDEFLWHPRGVRTYLEECTAKGIMLPRVSGYNMCADGFPNGWLEMGGNVQLTGLVQHGVPDPNFGKRCVFDTRLDMQYGAGCHPHDTRVNGSLVMKDMAIVGTFKKGEEKGIVGAIEEGDPALKLLHYRFWSEDDSATKASKTVLSEYNKKNQLGTHGQTDPEHERQAYRDAKAKRIKVI